MASHQLKQIHARLAARSEQREIRTTVLRCLGSMVSQASAAEQPLIKQAFDTRRTNQTVDYNPRTNLQSWHRSQPFVPVEMASGLRTLSRLKQTTDLIRADYQQSPDWHGSLASILCRAVDRTLRSDQSDGDHSEQQLAYLRELLYLRYRLTDDEINRLGTVELRRTVLGRDERLTEWQPQPATPPTGSLPVTTAPAATDQLTERLFGGVRATAATPAVTRTVTITIHDSIPDGLSVRQG